MKKRFYTIVELLTVFVIISIIFMISIGVFNLMKDKGNITKTRSTIKQIDAALQSYKITYGYYIPSYDLNAGEFEVYDVADGDNPYINIVTSEINKPVFYGINENNIFKFNIGGIDLDFIRLFEYQALKDQGSIRVYGNDEYEYVVDAWERPLLYYCSGTGGYFNDAMFDLGSLGRDGKYGNGSISAEDHYGTGDDITNFNNN